MNDAVGEKKQQKNNWESGSLFFCPAESWTVFVANNYFLKIRSIQLTIKTECTSYCMI